EPSQHFPLPLTASGGLGLVGRLRRVPRDEGLGAERLELHGVGAGGRGGGEPAGERGIAVVVDAGLGDEERGRRRADDPIADPEASQAHARISATTSSRRSVSRPSTGWRYCAANVRPRATRASRALASPRRRESVAASASTSPVSTRSTAPALT